MAKITITKTDDIDLRSINIGGLFEYEGNIFLKLSDEDLNGDIKCIRVDNGDTTKFKMEFTFFFKTKINKVIKANFTI